MHVGMGTFFQNLGRARSDQDVWLDQLSLVDEAEGLGFDSVWTTEHHFTDYTMCPSPTQLLTWVAARTERVKLGSMVNVLPWHEPVRFAEELSVLDNISGGRVICGIGRGLGRVEFDGYGVPMGESRERFGRYAQAIVEAFDTGSLTIDGRSVPIRPAPFASLRGRTYASSVSPESIGLIARLGIGIMVIAQKPWEQAAADLETYRTAYREHTGTEPPKPILCSFVVCHRDHGVAEELFERHLVRYCGSTIEHYRFDDGGLAHVPGYEFYGRLSEHIARHGRDAFSRFLADLQPWGTPAEVTETIVEQVRLLDAAGVIALFNFGGIPTETARETQRLFAREVLPVLGSLDTDRVLVAARR